jgi:hypothetical protein
MSCKRLTYAINYECPKTEVLYNLIITHQFSKVDTNIDGLSYYISVNDDKVHSGSPRLVDTIPIDDFFESDYIIQFPKIVGITETDQIRLHIFLPFDHQTSIKNVIMKIDSAKLGTKYIDPIIDPITP